MDILKFSAKHQFDRRVIAQTLFTDEQLFRQVACDIIKQMPYEEFEKAFTLNKEIENRGYPHDYCAYSASVEIIPSDWRTKQTVYNKDNTDVMMLSLALADEKLSNRRLQREVKALQKQIEILTEPQK